VTRSLAWGALLPLLALLCACPREGPPSGRAAPARESEPRDVPAAIPVPVGLPSEPGEAGARDFVSAFLELRVRGDEPRAKDFLSENALAQFEKREKGLALTSMSYTGWELVALRAADASSYEATVRIRREDEPVEEMLFIGPGPDTSGAQRTWIVRGAARP
jgi:hypothetical protein